MTDSSFFGKAKARGAFEAAMDKGDKNAALAALKEIAPSLEIPEPKQERSSDSLRVSNDPIATDIKILPNGTVAIG